jgi:hypothetical protein
MNTASITAARFASGSIVLLGLLAAAPASADPLRFTASGTYNAVTPVSFFTAPNATWSMSFIFDSTPVPLLPELGQYFSVPFSNFSVTLDGAVLPVVPVAISFYNGTTNSGGADMFFNALSDPAQGFEFYGPQVYTGDEFNPTIVPGVYDTFLAGGDGFSILVNGTRIDQGQSQFVIAAVPLPPALLLWFGGLALLGTVAARQRPG